MSQEENSPSADVTVCVIDEEKGVQKSYSCSRELIVSHVGYLAELFKASSLEIKEVSIHCDINIFNWLLQWIRKVDSSPGQLPVLDAENVFPVLVSAEFLVMKSLVSLCLKFIHDNINKIVLPANVLQILSKDTLSRLFDTFSNLEIEEICKENDAVKKHFYSKLIESLLEQEVCFRQGHYYSVSSLFKCAFCSHLVHAGNTHEGRSISLKVWCTPANIMLSPSMAIINFHKRDGTWTVREHVGRVMRKLEQCSRAVYWRLWGQCHFLCCATCSAYFPVGQASCCPYHRDEPQPGDDGRWAYPCCQAPAFPADPLKDMPGCHFREHCPILETNIDNEIFKVYMRHKDLIAVSREFQQSYKQYMFQNFIDKDKHPWWTALTKSPSHKNYLVPDIWEIYPNKESLIHNSKMKKGVKIIYERVRMVKETKTSTDGSERACIVRTTSSRVMLVAWPDRVVHWDPSCFFLKKLTTTTKLPAVFTTTTTTHARRDSECYTVLYFCENFRSSIATNEGHTISILKHWDSESTLETRRLLQR